MATGTAVEFSDVEKTYRSPLWPTRGVKALFGVSLSIPVGSTFGLLGPNRAGKSTFLKILLCVCKPERGRANRLGRPVDDKSTLARVGYMHENQAFPRYLTAPALLDFYGRLGGLSPYACRVRGRKLLERVGLADRTNEAISQFSKGMVQRLALAQALMNEPELLVLDEPTEGLDQLARGLIYEVIAEQKAAGKTTVLVSHILPDVERTCDRAALLLEGKVAAEGSIAELCTDPATGAVEPLERAMVRWYRTK